ncbi:MAG: ABC transporter ATP-binding protein, partial [Alphaproteobacteria bacterium]|nr:ABC transporter ATP-binding protein [Alphaproteobacteria bacterium]
MGLGGLKFWKRRRKRFHEALKGISFELRKGERLAVIGRNGAGKSTLLKLFNENFQPTLGHIEVNGTVQALLHTGLGFFPDFTGYENLRSSLLYNGLSPGELEGAIAEIVDFVELGEFLHQPFKTYSLGMRSRLQFAAATAIHPDILLIDEVLGAGDAYFTAKSALRVKALTGSGCTLILVSHSMEQVLQFCERAIWLEAGAIVMDGLALPVVRAYEEYARRLEHEAKEAKASARSGSILANDKIREQVLSDVLERSRKVASGALAD